MMHRSLIKDITLIIRRSLKDPKQMMCKQMMHRSFKRPKTTFKAF